MLKNILIKASGDVTEKEDFFSYVNHKSQEGHVVVISGGGTKISAALKTAGFKIIFDDKNRRVTKTLREKQIARDVLELEQARLQDEFQKRRVSVEVIIPMHEYGSVLVPINGDDMLKDGELGFDKMYVLTTSDRVEGKIVEFADYSIEVIGVE